VISSEEKALIEHIREDHLCETSRLVYADYLEETDRKPRADFIRASVAVSKFGKSTIEDVFDDLDNGGGGEVTYMQDYGPLDKNFIRCRMAVRKMIDAFRSAPCEDILGIPEVPCMYAHHRSWQRWPLNIQVAVHELSHHNVGHANVEFGLDNGLIRAVDVADIDGMGWWMEYGDLVIDRHPYESLTAYHVYASKTQIVMSQTSPEVARVQNAIVRALVDQQVHASRVSNVYMDELSYTDGNTARMAMSRALRKLAGVDK